MKKLIIFISSLGILTFGFFYAKNQMHLFQSPTAFAVGDLNVDFGVPNGSPIFTISNFAPGDSESHQVTVTNGASTSRPLGIKGTKTSAIPQDFDNELQITISQDGTDIYGGTNGAKTLKDFFDATSGVNGISLGNIDSGEQKIFVITVSFDKDAGNDFQNAKITFNLSMGIQINLPEACSKIKFKNIIYGTSGNDKINAGSGDTLIVGFDGNDTINAGSGNDCIIDGNGNNKINSGSGNDVIQAGTGNNKIDAGSGNDTVNAGGGSNKIDGGSGDDYLNNGSNLTGNINGGSGKDTCIAKSKSSCEK